MAEPIKVTFDKNVYEFVVDPKKDAPISADDRRSYEIIHHLILQGRIIPFISETILTYEAVAKKERLNVLSKPKRFLIKAEGSKITIGSNPAIFPGAHARDDRYLRAAISMGFKILPGKRLGKLVNPSINAEWYYYMDEDYLQTSERFSDIVKIIQGLGGGYTQYIDLITTPLNKHFNPQERLTLFEGNPKILSAAIAEWSDGDSVALHLTYGLTYFCTNDNGKNATLNATLGIKVSAALEERFSFKKVNPFQLVKIMANY